MTITTIIITTIIITTIIITTTTTTQHYDARRNQYPSHFFSHIHHRRAS